MTKGLHHFTDRPKDKVVGVLGGMGPHATADFLALLVRLTPTEKDWNHLHIVVENNPRMPSRTRAFLFGEESPVPYLIEGARRLSEMGAEIIAVACNSATHFLNEVRDAVAVPILDPVHATAEVLRRDGRCRRPLVLGGLVTARAGLYAKALVDTAIEPEVPSDSEQAEVTRIIEELKRNRTDSEVVKNTLQIIDAGRAKGVDGVILGCTEFGLIAEPLARSVSGVPIYNSNEILARAVVQSARHE